MRHRSFIIAATILLIASQVFAQQPYKLPPKEVVDILDAPPTPRVLESPTGDLLALVEYKPMPAIADLCRTILRIAGSRIVPDQNSQQILNFNTALSLKDIRTGSLRRISLPDGIRFAATTWSPDGEAIAFLRYVEGGVELWSLDIGSGIAKALTGPVVNTVTRSFAWMPDGRSLLVSLVLEGRGPAPEPPHVPAGPNVRETSGKAAKVATYQDLLKNASDEALFEYYAASQLVVVDASSGLTQKIGKPGLFAAASASPDANSFLVDRIKKPFSYSVPYEGFAHAYEVWDRDGAPVACPADLPPADTVPMNGVPTGPRDMEWLALKPATLIWVEALDGGDPEKEAAFRDRMMTLAAPFTGPPTEVFRFKDRAQDVAPLATAGLALASEFDWKKRWRTTWLVNLDHPGTPPRKIFERNSQDRYNDPGFPVRITLKTGERVVLQDRDWIYLNGAGASPKGDHPFLDRLDLKTLKKERLFQCQDPAYEDFVTFLGTSRREIVLRRETKAEPPNYYLYDLKNGRRKALTEFPDPAPLLTGVKTELVTYTREDGVELSGTLYLPPGYKPGTRLPVVIWAYPLEYNDAGTAGQVRGSVNRFPFYRGASHLFFVTQGYAVLDNAQMPVVGDPKTVNDTFVRQIVSNAAAAIKKLDEMGVGDPKRVGIGGHSYGAFMTTNLLAHCDLFAAGIARSGAYNRTLTPFGFQSERRTLWEAPDTYINMSPFMHADSIKTPLLLIHGEADNNSGTFPIQSERLFAALQGFGATARLVILPFESHGYSARESVLHVLAEMFDWFETYVKNRK
jgi:dipeptidyl aminopeptidase/acylaminoacyl peptidase